MSKGKRGSVLDARGLIANAFNTICTIEIDRRFGSDMAILTIDDHHVTLPLDWEYTHTSEMLAQRAARGFIGLLIPVINHKDSNNE